MVFFFLEKKKFFYWRLNGGPGCSSLIGLFSENGPFRPTIDGKSLIPNEWSWNSIANIIYLESPAGVGFSYSNNKNDYYTDDIKTAKDNYNALIEWFKKFPSFIHRDFYIAGESYAGHYIPTLANEIIEANKNNKNLQINLKGILVGNGLTVDAIDLNSPIDIWAYHGLISWDLYTKLLDNCNGNYISNPSQICNQYIFQAHKEIGNIDFYDIYAPVCENHQKKNFIRFNHPLIQKMPFDPCIDLHLTEYLNRLDVQKAIHVFDGKLKVWDECSSKLNYNFTEGYGQSMIPYYKKFFQEMPNLRILIFSGDVDSVVPFLGTEKWIESLHLKKLSPRKTWLLPNKQIGGYIQQYDKLTYLSIRGAGHMVPYFKPYQAYIFFSKFIQQQPF